MTGTPALRGQAVELVPVAAEHVTELRRILRTPEVRARWREEDASPQWPFDDYSATRFAVLLEGTVRGMVQYGEEDEPDYRHASIDIFLDPAVHGRGVGRDAVAALARHLVRDRGHHRLVIDPAADNERAIRCYRAVGFRPVGSCDATSVTPTGPDGTTPCSWTFSPRNSTSSADSPPCSPGTAGVVTPASSRSAYGAAMRRGVIVAVSLYVCAALGTGVAEAVGMRRCECSSSCWCQTPLLSASFRWVVPVGHPIAERPPAMTTCPRAAVGKSGLVTGWRSATDDGKSIRGAGGGSGPSVRKRVQ